MQDILSTLDPVKLNLWRAIVENKPSVKTNLRLKLTKYIKEDPTPKQKVFLLQDRIEGLYGGAASGGKTSALLAGALQYVDVPGYSALILRRTYPQLAMPDSIMSRAQQWLRGTDALWQAEKKQFLFPSGATIQFGYLQYFKDVYQYDGPSFQYIAFDELTQFHEEQYRFMFGRLRRLKNLNVPLRMRGATNPGNVGHVWVKNWFIDSTGPERFFVPAKLKDNPHMDQDAYRRALSRLDPILRKQREDGDWDVSREGTVFKREWMKFTDHPFKSAYRIRFWDLAATDPKPGKDPDYTVGSLVARNDRSEFCLEDLRRERMEPSRVERLIIDTARLDGPEVKIRIEQEGGASGKSLISSYVRMLPGYDVAGVRASGSKLARYMPLASAMREGTFFVLNAPWNPDFYDELCNVPDVTHDDQADSVAGAYNSHVAEPPAAFGISRIGGNSRA